jgi:hypothetical protein
MDEMFGLTKTDLRFWRLLWEENPEDHMYVYWIENGEKISPAILKNVTPFSDLEMFLQRRYGAQSYCAIIRRGKKMILKHIFHIAQPLKFSPEADIRADIKNLQRAERGDFVGAES